MDGAEGLYIGQYTPVYWSNEFITYSRSDIIVI